MKSSDSAFWSIKYGPLVFGLLFIVIPILNLIDPELATFNGEHKQMDMYSFSLFMMIGILAILLFLMFQNKFVIVEMGNQSLKVIRGNRAFDVNWLDVKSVSLLPFIFPPIYKLRVKGEEDYFLFATSRFGINVAGYTKDFSEMGSLISKKKRELGI